MTVTELIEKHVETYKYYSCDNGREHQWDCEYRDDGPGPIGYAVCKLCGFRPQAHQFDHYKNFAIALLKLMKGSGAPCSFVAQQNAVIVRTIDKALEELRK